MRNRRWFLFLVPMSLAMAINKVPIAPTDENQWNSFAATCNSYTDLLKQGILDSKAWARVVAAWRRLTGA